MSENEIGYRGSKSDFIKKSVKEQRVDGSWCKKPLHLRCTLMGFERNYQIKILSSPLQLRKNLSTLKPKIDPYFISGLIDSEGYFSTTVYKNIKYKLGWSFKTVFAIGLHSRELSLLLQLQEFFGGIGSIRQSKTHNMVFYSVSSIKDLTTIIIPHFETYLLLSQKAADFILFKQIVKIMSKKEHLTLDGPHQIINIKAAMNWGLSNKLKYESIQVNPVERPLIITKKISSPNWVSGFVTGEGNFNVTISKAKDLKSGFKLQLRFRIYQHDRDLKLMELIIKYLGSGRIEKDSRKAVVSLTITKISDILNIVIPFFEKYPLKGIKQLDYLDFCKIANLMKEGSHLTTEGLDLIRTIKSGMNRGRKLD